MPGALGVPVLVLIESGKLHQPPQRSGHRRCWSRCVWVAVSLACTGLCQPGLLSEAVMVSILDTRMEHLSQTHRHPTVCHHPVNCLLSTQSCVNLHNTLQKHLIIWKLQPQIQLSYPDHTNDSFDDWRKLKCSTLLSSPGVLNLLQEFFSFSP